MHCQPAPPTHGGTKQELFAFAPAGRWVTSQGVVQSCRKNDEISNAIVTHNLFGDYNSRFDVIVPQLLLHMPQYAMRDLCTCQVLRRSGYRGICCLVVRTRAWI